MKQFKDLFYVIFNPYMVILRKEKYIQNLFKAVEKRNDLISKLRLENKILRSERRYLKNSIGGYKGGIMSLKAVCAPRRKALENLSYISESYPSKEGDSAVVPSEAVETEARQALGWT